MELKKYANVELECGLDKEPDFVAKSEKSFVVGEAKLLTATGGHQNTSFEDALRLLKGTSGKAHRVAVLDGII